MKINLLQLIIGISSLLIGTMFYLIDRAVNSTYFLVKLNITSYDYDMFGYIGNHLPTFIHTFSFCLITAGLLACKRQCYLIVVTCWFLFEYIF